MLRREVVELRRKREVTAHEKEAVLAQVEQAKQAVQPGDRTRRNTLLCKKFRIKR